VSAIATDFDRLALLDDARWTHNNHYHKFLFRHVPASCSHALEIGCGTGAFSIRLARKSKHVVALDLSPEMIRIARTRSSEANIEYRCADLMTCDWPRHSFDCIASIAALHHLPMREALLKLKPLVRPDGVLMVLDLFEPEHNVLKPAGWRDAASNILAMGVSGSLRLLHDGRLLPPRAVRDAWEAHGKTDHYLTMKEVRALCEEILPGAAIRQHLLWRYSIIWRKTVQD
jgi:SAM-dependent methyltransferase